MSIEDLLLNLITALNDNTKALNSDSVDVSSTRMEAASRQKQLSSKSPPPPDALAAADNEAAEETKSPTPTADEAAVTAAKPITGDQMNHILKKEFVRIGNVRAPIDKIMKELFDVDSLHNLKDDHYAELTAAIAQIPSA